jgi:hypothetical protein
MIIKFSKDWVNSLLCEVTVDTHVKNDQHHQTNF